jgi:hypothetical protein
MFIISILWWMQWGHCWAVWEPWCFYTTWAIPCSLRHWCFRSKIQHCVSWSWYEYIFPLQRKAESAYTIPCSYWRTSVQPRRHTWTQVSYILALEWLSGPPEHLQTYIHIESTYWYSYGLCLLSLPRTWNKLLYIINTHVKLSLVSIQLSMFGCVFLLPHHVWSCWLYVHVNTYIRISSKFYIGYQVLQILKTLLIHKLAMRCKKCTNIELSRSFVGSLSCDYYLCDAFLNASLTRS